MDPDWILKRNGIQPKMLVPDPDQMQTDPKHCIIQCSDTIHSTSNKLSPFSKILTLLQLHYIQRSD
jgi:hypothetical protein